MMSKQRIIYYEGIDEWPNLNAFVDSCEYGHTHYLVLEYVHQGYLNYLIYDLRLNEIHISVGPSDRKGVQTLIAKLDREYQQLFAN